MQAPCLNSGLFATAELKDETEPGPGAQTPLTVWETVLRKRNATVTFEAYGSAARLEEEERGSRREGARPPQHKEGRVDSLKPPEILEAQRLKLWPHRMSLKGRDPQADHKVQQKKSWMMVLGWPWRLPELNPIENLWWDSEKVVAAHKTGGVFLELEAREEWGRVQPPPPRESGTCSSQKELCKVLESLITGGWIF